MPMPLPLEFMFNRLLIEEAIEEGVLVLQPRIARIANDELPLEVSVDAVIQDRIEDRYRYLAKEVSDRSKVAFADWAAAKENDVFEPFRATFQELSIAVAN